LLSATVIRVISVRKKLLISMHGKLTIFHSPGRPPAATVATAASSQVFPNSFLHYKCSLVMKFVILCDILDTSAYETFDIYIKQCKQYISLREYYVISGSCRAMKHCDYLMPVRGTCYTYQLPVTVPGTLLYQVHASTCYQCKYPTRYPISLVPYLVKVRLAPMHPCIWLFYHLWYVHTNGKVELRQ